MSRTDHQRPRGELFHAGQLLPLVLLPLLALLPPETRGESLAAAALLISILALHAWTDPRLRTARILFLVVATLALPAAGAALAPGAV